jgi:hypothetical protein
MQPSPSVGCKLGCRVACHHLHAELIVPGFLSNDRNVITSIDQSAVRRKLDTAYIFGLCRMRGDLCSTMHAEIQRSTQEVSHRMAMIGLLAASQQQT